MTKTMFLLLLCGAGLVLIGGRLLLDGARWGAKEKNLFEHSWRIERFFYRHHRLAGGLIVIFSLIFLLLLAIYSGQQVTFTGFWGTPRGFMILRVVSIAAWFCSSFALLVGTVVLLRPSLLKPLETRANQWITPIPSLRFHTGRIGTILLLAGLACLFTAFVTEAA